MAKQAEQAGFTPEDHRQADIADGGEARRRTESEVSQWESEDGRLTDEQKKHNLIEVEKAKKLLGFSKE